MELSRFVYLSQFVGLCCCMRAFPSCGQRVGGYCAWWCMGSSLPQVSSLVGHRLWVWSIQKLQHAGCSCGSRLWSAGSVVVAQDRQLLREATSVFLDQRANRVPCIGSGSYPLYHLGRPELMTFNSVDLKFNPFMDHIKIPSQLQDSAVLHGHRSNYLPL